MAGIAAAILAADQGTKALVLRFLPYLAEHSVVDGFFKLVHWGNKGAAWSLFNNIPGSNYLLAIVSITALTGLLLFRHHFEIRRPAGRLALGLMIGGIVGNLIDRLHPTRGHVIDFLYFYHRTDNGRIVDFPAFNIADSAICTGVGLMILLSWWRPHAPNQPAEPVAEKADAAP